MKIAVIGAGFTGLSAAYQLSKKGHKVTVFEKDPIPGGLAIGYKEKKWSWSLEKHYHHWFSNDSSILNLANEIGHNVIIRRPKTSVYIDGKNYQLDSPTSLLKFPLLTFPQRLRMAAVLGFLRYNPFWKPLEKIQAERFLKNTMGEKAYAILWEPQLKNKFGAFKKDISLAWFWARIKKRTPSLAYPSGGFLEFANALVAKIRKSGGTFLFNTEVLKLIPGKKIIIKTGKESFEFDKVIITLPSFFFTKIAGLPSGYKNSLIDLKGLGAINIVLRLKNTFLKDNTYWLSICDSSAPIMAIVEHTNYMDKKYYNNEHIVYLGNYLPKEHRYFSLDKETILKEYDSFLHKLNNEYRKNLIDFEVFKAPFAQPIIPPNYSKMLPPFKTPIQNVYLANIQQVYPWDRGTNYAVELGETVVNYLLTHD